LRFQPVQHAIEQGRPPFRVGLRGGFFADKLSRLDGAALEDVEPTREHADLVGSVSAGDDDVQIARGEAIDGCRGKPQWSGDAAHDRNAGWESNQATK